MRTAKRVVGFCGTATAALAGPANWSPTNLFAPASTPAQTILGLSIFVLAVTGAIFPIVFGLLANATAVKPGCLTPTMGLSDPELNALSAYMETLH